MKSSFVNASLRTGCLIAGWVQLVHALMFAVQIIMVAIVAHAGDHEVHWHLHPGIQITTSIMLLAASISLLYGTNKNSPEWLIPYIVYSIFYIAAWTILGLFLIFFHNLHFTIATAIGHFIFIAFSTYCLFVACSFNQELRQNQLQRRSNSLLTPNV